MKTVIIETINEQNVLRMVWQQYPKQVDIRVAFKQIEDHLNKSNVPLYVVVVLPPDIRFPVGQTVWEALPCYRHERLEAWLVVGGNGLAKLIESTLARVTKRNNVCWFKSEPEALSQFGLLHDIGAD